MDILIGVISVLALLVIWVAVANRLVLMPCTILEHERGLLYRRGRFQRVLDPGGYWFLRRLHTVYRIDMRERYVTLVGQEVLTADNISIRISLAASFKVADPFRAVNETEKFHEALYLLLQLRLRDLVGALNVDELLAKRQEIGAQLHENMTAPAAAIGLTLVMVGIRDIMFPGDLKQIFAQIVNARKEGLAALERARGESAALRNLANAARLLENNPALLHLRLLQTLGSSSGNTVIWGPNPTLAEIAAEHKPSRE